MKLELVQEGTPLEFALVVRDDRAVDKEIAGFLRSQWEEIGVDADLLIMTEPRWWGNWMGPYLYSSGEWDLSIYHSRSSIDPISQLFHHTNTAIDYDYNYAVSDCRYCSASYDENFTLSATELDADIAGEYADNSNGSYTETHAALPLRMWIRHTLGERTTSRAGATGVRTQKGA
ncbi:MAG: hypothetical protein JSV90_07410 [Methanobacteriota archaeon]|nr:MAG: hypothetical protein JSV90_07410 [Euryarchaeota archaeon]